MTKSVFLVEMTFNFVNPLSANPTNWPNTLKQIADELFECV